MREIATQIEIASPAAKVWSILTDFGRFGQWNPFVRQIEGDLKEGAGLRVCLQLPGRKEMNFTPRITKLTKEREFSWLGHLWIPGLFDGEHIFELEPIDNNSTRFIQRERFRGILVPLVWSSLEKRTREGFEGMNLALKKQAEEG